jgi:hypothetical protein
VETGKLWEPHHLFYSDNCTKLKSFYTLKETKTRMKRQSIKWKKIFSSYFLDKKLISRTYKKLKKLNTERTNNPIVAGRRTRKETDKPVF